MSSRNGGTLDGKNGDSLTRNHRLRVYSHSALHNDCWRLRTVTLGTDNVDRVIIFVIRAPRNGRKNLGFAICKQNCLSTTISSLYCARYIRLPNVCDRSTRPSFDLFFFFFVTIIYLQYTSVLQRGKNSYRATQNYTIDADRDNQLKRHSLPRVKSLTDDNLFGGINELDH